MSESKPGTKPLPCRISSWGSASEVIYSCPNCATSFAILGRQELFCHHCGEKINWGVIIRVNNAVKRHYHSQHIEGQEKILREIKNLNESFSPDVTDPQELTESII